MSIFASCWPCDMSQIWMLDFIVKEKEKGKMLSSVSVVVGSKCCKMKVKHTKTRKSEYQASLASLLRQTNLYFIYSISFTSQLIECFYFSPKTTHHPSIIQPIPPNFPTLPVPFQKYHPVPSHKPIIQIYNHVRVPFSLLIGRAHNHKVTPVGLIQRRQNQSSQSLYQPYL